VELKLRNTYGLEVLMIKNKNTFLNEVEEEIIIPDAHYKIKPDDTLILFGADEKIILIDNWN
jgi:Trk K+ transport system NAD-binding subunit